MSDDLVKRLRKFEGSDYVADGDFPTCGEAADRIEQLEYWLREIIEAWDWWQVDTYDRCKSVPSDAIREARAALENKNDR
jgi:hypothetical protein